MNGRVFLVGAGPGDPELLTIKAARLLKEADVVLHDDLVSPEVLALVRPAAWVRNVGKRCGRKHIHQEEIHFLMIAAASQGLRVVRLKCGDPMIFGRAGEEIEALRKAGIAFEIVPGVTAALAAASAAQIPLTHRRLASSVVLLTGTHAAGNEPTDLHALAAARATLVFYMPGRDYGVTARALISAGLDENTACAVLSRASQPNHQAQVTSLKGLPSLRPLESPALLVVGSVVELADQRVMRQVADVPLEIDLQKNSGVQRWEAAVR